VPKREVLQVESGLRFEGRRGSDGQHVKRTERQMEELTEETQTPCSHSVQIYDRHTGYLLSKRKDLQAVSAQAEDADHRKQRQNKFTHEFSLVPRRKDDQPTAVRLTSRH